MTHPDLMIFAAGLGKRMAPLTDTRPKPLIPVGGMTLLDRAIGLARAADVGRIVVNTHYLGQQIADHLSGQDILISPEQERLETGGGLRHALPLFAARSGQPVQTLNPDGVFAGPNPLIRVREGWRAGMGALLLVAPLDRVTGRVGGGDFTLGPDGRLNRGGDYVYLGAHMCDPSGLWDIKDRVFSLNLLWDRYMAQGRVFGVVYDGHWADVGRPEAIPLAEQVLERAA